MKVGVLEWDVSQLGGRHRTMCAFADALDEHTGWEVSLLSQRPQGIGAWRMERLVPERICRWIPLKRTMTREETPAALGALDVLIIPYGGFGYLQGHFPDVTVIQWVIHPEQARFQEVKHTWTNSETTLARLENCLGWKGCGARVIAPPHDLSPFAYYQTDPRMIDVLCVGSLLRSKRLVEFAEIAKERRWNAVILGSCWPDISYEAGMVMTEILEQGIPLRVNVSRQEMARYMGASKVIASMSTTESAPLISWEAMAAGAIPVMRSAGAVREQLGELGLVSTLDEDFATDVERAIIDENGRDSLVDYALEHRGREQLAVKVINAILEARG